LPHIDSAIAQDIDSNTPLYLFNMADNSTAHGPVNWERGLLYEARNWGLHIWRPPRSGSRCKSIQCFLDYPDSFVPKKTVMIVLYEVLLSSSFKNFKIVFNTQHLFAHHPIHPPCPPHPLFLPFRSRSLLCLDVEVVTPAVCHVRPGGRGSRSETQTQLHIITDNAWREKCTTLWTMHCKDPFFWRCYNNTVQLKKKVGTVL